MKRKNRHHIFFAIVILILGLPACISGITGTGLTPTVEETEQGAQPEPTAAAEETEQGGQPEPTAAAEETEQGAQPEPTAAAEETEQGAQPEPTAADVRTASVEPTQTASDAPSQIENGSLDFDGWERSYAVFLPKSYDGTKNYPLVIYLHSYGWTAQKGMNYTALNEVADTHDFIAVYPGARTNWNSGIGDHSQWPTRDNDDVGFIEALIDVLSSDYAVDSEMVYATGYSNGGFMAHKLACQLSHRIAAIAAVGGVISNSVLADCNPLRTMPVLQIHGTKDPWVPFEGNGAWHSVEETLAYWIDFNHCVSTDTIILDDVDPTDGSTVEMTSYTNCTDNSNVIFYKLINGGHIWPGAGLPGYPAGNANDDFNAGVEIWNFFKEYRLPPTSMERNGRGDTAC